MALALGGRRVRRLGLAAMGVLTVAGPLLVAGVLPFAVQLPIVLAAFVGLAAWILLVSRQLDGSVSRMGVLCGSGVLAGGAVAGLGALLPAMSWPQLALFGIGGVPAVLAMLAIPVWYLRLGRAEHHGAGSSAHSPSSVMIGRLVARLRGGSAPPTDEHPLPLRPADPRPARRAA